MRTKKSFPWHAIWYLLIFLFFFIWFSKLYPLVVYDTDDWFFLGHVRSAAPIWGAWNPAKVFPEFFMPLFSSLGCFLLMPFVGDYIDTMTITHALVVSGFLTVYFWSFSCLIKRLFSLPFSTTQLITSIFLLFHFWARQNGDDNNTYLFYCNDLNCYYNYLIPTVVNASIVMFLIGNPKAASLLSLEKPLRTGVCLVILYLAIFSNLVSSGVLAVYAGSCILLQIWQNRKHFSLVSFCKENGLYLGILAAWLVSAVFELSGGRASVSDSLFSWEGLWQTAKGYGSVLAECNRFFWISSIFFLLLGAGAFFFSGRRNGGNSFGFSIILTWLITAVVIHIYGIFLCASVSPYNISRSEYVFPTFFFLMLLTMLSLGYLFSRYPQACAVFPLFLLLLISEVNLPGKAYRESNISNFDGTVAGEISRNIVSQIVAADENGMKEMTLYVPVHVADPANADNWPHNLQDAALISSTLYEHGIISYPISLTVVASEEVNRLHHLPLPQAD